MLVGLPHGEPWPEGWLLCLSELLKMNNDKDKNDAVDHLDTHNDDNYDNDDFGGNDSRRSF